MAYRLNPPPNWPPAPPGFVPPQGWQPDPSWPPAPPGWQLWVPDDTQPGSAWPATAPAAPYYAAPGVPSYTAPGVPPYYAAGQPAPGQRAPGTNGFAIAAFVIGLLGGTVLSVIFGIVALSKLRRRPQRGKGLAIAGLCLSAVWVAVIIGVVAVNASTASQRSAATGQITKNGHLGVLSLRVGDCFQNPSGNQPASSELTQVTAVACTSPHNAQVISQLPVTGSAYPGEAAFRAQAMPGCRAALTAAADQSKLTSTMNLIWLYPESQAWADGQHMISCLVVDSSEDLTASLLK